MDNFSFLKIAKDIFLCPGISQIQLFWLKLSRVPTAKKIVMQ